MSTVRKFLVLPMQPTPNGRLHIGHCAGPYLRADAYARHLRRAGHDIQVICGSDVYENWILLDALRTGRTAEEICRSYHELIGADLRNMTVGIDAWINPLDHAHSTPYRLTHERLIKDLAAQGQAQVRSDRIPFSANTGRCVMGVWLLGRCPNCGDGVGGNCCETCGFHFQPSEVREPRSRLDEGPLRWSIQRSWFLTPTEPARIATSIAGCDLRRPLATVAARYMEQTSGLIRLSQPGSWGIESELAGSGAVLSNTFYGFSLYCGKVYAQRSGGLNPFALHSDVTTVAFFGVDNAIAGIVGPHALAVSDDKLKPFDHVVVNEFLHLEGTKCSTSRNHAIWLSELLESNAVAADELRYYMAQQPLERRPADFTVASFVDAVNDLRRWHTDVLAPALNRASADVDGEVLQRLRRVLKRQTAALEPSSMSLPDAVSALDEWKASAPPEGSDGAAVSSWLQGLALLAEPIMPTLAGELWRALGLPGRPAVGPLGPCRPSPTTVSGLAPRPPVSVADVRPFVHLETAHG